MISDEIADKIRIFLESIGIDVIYAVTIFGIIISVSYWNDLQNWEKIDWTHKSLICTTFLGTLFFIILSALRLVGIFDF